MKKAFTIKTITFLSLFIMATFHVGVCYATGSDARQSWLARVVQSATMEKENNPGLKLQPTVAALNKLIQTDSVVRMHVTRMIKQVPAADRDIKSVEGLLLALNYIVNRAPAYNPDPAKRNIFPVSDLFVHMMFTPAGRSAFTNKAFNDSIRKILKAWSSYLDSPASQSVLNTGEEGWLSPSAYEFSKLEEFVIPDKAAPHWGFASFNDYFHRQIKPDHRPIADPNDSKVIVSANDGTLYRIEHKVKKSDTFWLKSQPYSLTDMLDHSAYTDSFVGGDVFQSFLSGADYHRWRSPIDGVVKEARVVNGLMFSELASEGYDSSAGTKSQGYEASVNTRGLVFIQSDDPAIGMVCVIPIGITEISSVSIQVKAGQRVKKGDELGYFSYGGSSMALVFQPGAIRKFTVTLPEGESEKSRPTLKVNGQIAIAN
jgi:phosphatidylserine decarboxylase